MSFIFFSKYLKIDVKFRNAGNNWVKNFFVLDKRIWIGSGTLFLLRGEYLSSAVIVLKNSPKISDVTKRDIFQFNFLRVMEKCDKSAFVQISSLFGTLQRVDCLRIIWNGAF